MSAAIEALEQTLTDARAMHAMAQTKLEQAAQRVAELEQAIAILSGQFDHAAQRVAELGQALSAEPAAGDDQEGPAEPEPPAVPELQCPVCGDKFMSRKALAPHLRAHNAADKECPHCGRTLKSGPGYSAHVRFCPGPAGPAEPTPPADPDPEPEPVEAPAGLAAVITDLGTALGAGAEVAHLPPWRSDTTRAEHPAMRLCECAHSGRRHDDDGEGVCLAAGCGCTAFRRAAS